MDFLKKIPLKNLKDCGKIVAIIFLILIVVNIFMPRIEGLDGETPTTSDGESPMSAISNIAEDQSGGDDSGDSDSGSSNSFPSDGSGVDMYKVPGSTNPVTSECDSPEALNEDVCDFPPNINTAADACRAIQEKKAEMKAVSDTMDSISSMTPWGAISNIGEAIAGKSDTDNSLSTLISNTSNSINAQENETSCNNTINEVNVNAIEIDGGECKTNYARGLIEMGVSPDKAAELSLALNTDVNISGFSQEIKGKAEQSCNITATSNAFQGQGSSIDQAAIQSALSDIEGAGTISTNNASCNAIDNTQNACSYIKSTLCCNAVTNAMRKNILDIGCAHVDIKDSGQSVDTSSIQSCDLSNSQSSQQEQTTEIKQKSTQKSKASISGNPAMIIAAVVFGIIALFFIYKKLKGKSSTMHPYPPQYP